MPYHRNRERDRAIGARISLARIAVGLSRPELGSLLGVSPQQIFKYEAGTVRVAASMLDDLSAALAQPVVWFVQTDHHAIAVAACLQVPNHATKQRQFFRALKVLDPGIAVAARLQPPENDRAA